MIVTFEGYSDDIVHVTTYIKGKKTETEHYVNGAHNARFQVVTDHGEGCMVSGVLEANSVWAFSAFQLFDNQALPLGWRVSITNSPDVSYSLKMQIDTAIDVVSVKQVYP